MADVFLQEEVESDDEDDIPLAQLRNNTNHATSSQKQMFHDSAEDQLFTEQSVYDSRYSDPSMPDEMQLDDAPTTSRQGSQHYAVARDNSFDPSNGVYDYAYRTNNDIHQQETSYVGHAYHNNGMVINQSEQPGNQYYSNNMEYEQQPQNFSDQYVQGQNAYPSHAYPQSFEAPSEVMRLADGRVVRVVRSQVIDQQVYDAATNSYKIQRLIVRPNTQQFYNNQPVRLAHINPPQRSAGPKMLSASMSQQMENQAEENALLQESANMMLHEDEISTVNRFVNTNNMNNSNYGQMKAADNSHIHKLTPTRYSRMPPPLPPKATPLLNDSAKQFSLSVKPTTKVSTLTQQQTQSVPSSESPYAEVSSRLQTSSSQNSFSSAASQPVRAAKPQPNENATLKKTIRAAQLEKAKRLSTSIGWRKMNTWLKTTVDDSKMIDLLQQLKLANVPVDLLIDTTVDTPRYLNKLRKKSSNATVRELADMLVARYKHNVKNSGSDVAVKAKKEKAKREAENGMEDEVVDDYTDAPDIPQPSQKSNTSLVKPKEHRTKAKMHISKSRLTGLEESPKSKVAEAKPLRLATEQRPSRESKEKEKPKEKPKPRVVASQFSSSFLDAFAPKTQPPKKIVPKRENTEKPAASDVSAEKRSKPVAAENSSISTVPTTNIVLGGLFSDVGTEQTAEPEKPVSEQESAAPKRRVHFADDRGKPLVDVHEFEVDQNERYNVSMMTPEEIAKKDLELEKLYKQEHLPNDDDSQIVEGDAAPAIPWRCIEVQNRALSSFEKKGTYSEETRREKQRQSLVPFVPYHGIPLPISSEEPREFAPLNYVPCVIPLETIVDADMPSVDAPVIPVEPVMAIPTQRVESAPAAPLPESLQSLLSNLKKSGMIKQEDAESRAGAPGPSQPSPPRIEEESRYYPPDNRQFYGRQSFRGLPRNRIPCNFFKSQRGCSFGDRCHFSHDPQDFGNARNNRPYIPRARDDFHPRYE